MFTASGRPPRASEAHSKCGSASPMSESYSSVKLPFWCWAYGTPRLGSTRLCFNNLSNSSRDICRSSGVTKKVPLSVWTTASPLPSGVTSTVTFWPSSFFCRKERFQRSSAGQWLAPPVITTGLFCATYSLKKTIGSGTLPIRSTHEGTLSSRTSADKSKKTSLIFGAILGNLVSLSGKRTLIDDEQQIAHKHAIIGRSYTIVLSLHLRN
mmetsp:Transcript_9045/g.18731  ORF Transcript_9045/g.18731 Transcript_9045/m.18731 type:complete len:210 (-) Transcript_9045:46-675(-)